MVAHVTWSTTCRLCNVQNYLTHSHSLLLYVERLVDFCPGYRISKKCFFYQSGWEQTKFDEFVCKRGKSKCFSSKQHHNFRFQFETPFSVIPACSISSASTCCFYATDEIYKSEYCLLYATTHKKMRARALQRKTCLLTATVAKMDRMGSNLVTLCCERGWKNRNQLQPPALKRLGVAM